MKPATIFLEYLETIFGREAEVFKGISAEDGGIEPAVLVFNDAPKKGYMTAVTYGLSLGDHEKWRLHRKPELVLTIDSLNKDYAVALADMVSKTRSTVPFLYGERIRIGKVFENSNVEGFVVFAPLFIEKESYMDIDVGLDYKICLNGVYPITSGESEVIDMIGFENFWKDGTFNLTTFQK